MMELLLAPNHMLENPVTMFDFERIHPAPFAEDMRDLMYMHKGLGLSANQVGVPFQIFVMKTKLNKKFNTADGITVVINPVIKAISEERELGPEGCLSHPGLILNVKRPISCIVEFDTLTNDYRHVIHVDTKFDDIDARIFLHEYDHLHGIQFIDRVSKLKLQLAEKKRVKRTKNGRT